MVSNTIVIVDKKIVNKTYLQQKANILLAEIDAKFDMFIDWKQQLLAEIKDSNDRVDNKFKKLYS